MPNDLPAGYFDAIVRGVTDSVPAENQSAVSSIQLEQVGSLVRRVHSLRHRPCGKSIAWLIEKWRVCRLAEVSIQVYREEAADLSTAGAGVAMDLSKIVVRLYAQTEDSAIKVRCLNLIDEMERHHFMGLSGEVERLDR